MTRKLNSKHSEKTCHGVNTVVNYALFKQYLQDKLWHLSHAQRSVMESVFVNYRRIFHEEWSDDFQNSGFAEHKIVTADAKLIRQSPYRVPFALRNEMEDQVQNMLIRKLLRKVHRRGQPQRYWYQRNPRIGSQNIDSALIFAH